MSVQRQRIIFMGKELTNNLVREETQQQANHSLHLFINHKFSFPF
jgi:hypothetical protein